MLTVVRVIIMIGVAWVGGPVIVINMIIPGVLKVVDIIVTFSLVLKESSSLFKGVLSIDWQSFGSSRVFVFMRKLILLEISDAMSVFEWE
jgi:hypothetical protein